MTSYPFDIGKPHVRSPGSTPVCHRRTCGGSWRNAPPKSHSAAPTWRRGLRTDAFSPARQQHQHNHEMSSPRDENIPLMLSPHPHDKVAWSYTQPPWERYTKKKSPRSSGIMPAPTSAFHSHAYPRLVHPSVACVANPRLSFLGFFTCAPAFSSQLSESLAGFFETSQRNFTVTPAWNDDRCGTCAKGDWS